MLERLRRTLSGPALLQGALGLVYFHFGFLKFFPDLSPAEMIASQTILRMGFTIDASYVLFVLAAWECLVGAMLLFGIAPRVAAVLMLGHLVGTMAPLVMLPELTFKFFPFAPSIEGQYILKNVVFVAAALAILAADRRRTDRPMPRPVAAGAEERRVA